MRRIAVAVVLGLVAAVAVAQAEQATGTDLSVPGDGAGVPDDNDLPDIPQPQIDDPISDAELADLQTIADQRGMSLEAAIDRYAWNDNFALAVAQIRQAHPDAFTGAEIVGGEDVWVAFAAEPPDAAVKVIESFATEHVGVAVEVRPNLGFSEVEIERAVAKVHYSLLHAAAVRGVSTSFDFVTRRITSIVALARGGDDAALDEVRARAIKTLVESAPGRLREDITVTVVESNLLALGGTEAHIGGEILSTCTSGFAVQLGSVTGVSMAGHCPNPQNDAGVGLAWQGGHEGAWGDFEWRTGPETEPDDFFAGDAGSTEVNRRDVAAVGNPVVGMAICKNGKATHRGCNEVIQLNVCHFSICNLVQTDTKITEVGDSGGPWYWANTAYGIHMGYRTDPFPPFTRSLFSRADRIGNAIGVSIRR